MLPLSPCLSFFLPAFRAETVLAPVFAHSELLSLCPKCPGSSRCWPSRGPGYCPPSTSALEDLFSAAGSQGAGATALNLQGAVEPSQPQEGSRHHSAGLLQCGEVAGKQLQSEPPELPTCSRALLCCWDTRLPKCCSTLFGASGTPQLRLMQGSFP